MTPGGNEDQTAETQAYHDGALVWVPYVEGGGKGASDMLYSDKKKVKRWLKGSVVGSIISTDGSPFLEVLTEDGVTIKDVTVEECPLRNERDDTVDDLVKSDFLHEPGILHTLRVRYTLDMIYTYSANILIAANPHKRLRHLYGSRMMNQYKGSQLGELSPHVYAIAEQAFNCMMMDEQRQAILISGESGAGKTESAKTVMQYLANRGTAPRGREPNSPRSIGRHHSLRPQESRVLELAAEGGDGASAPIEEQVLESNPLLEAFGNAKTSRNENSSRFGKFVEMYFDLWGRVTGASINTYLLERSRVVSIASPERSYHIFYQLIAGADPDQRQLLKLGNDPREFRYLAQSEMHHLNHVDDAEEFRRTLDAMRIVGLTEAEQDGVLRIVSAVLHLGNVTFEQEDYDSCTLAGTMAVAELNIVAELLQVNREGLEKALLTRTIETVGEKITKQLDVKAASEARDALAKNIYARLFDWLVSAINKKISAIGTGRKTPRTIGILDIYGFESFKENSFEQLCINLANERLQQQFNGHVFKGEQEEYQREGIDWSYVEFIDNQDCLDLLEGLPANHAVGVFPLIDEACRMPRATYEGLAHTIRTKLVEHKRFGAPKRPPHAFVIDHFAGRVNYSTQFLLDKNKDFVVAEHAALLNSSDHAIIRDIFAEVVQETDPSEEGASPKKAKREVKSSFKFNSVGLQFRKQLAGLMATLNECHPHYIRCIKPNPESKPGSLVPEYVLEQLRAGGVLEAVRIACAGFPTRKEFIPFAQRYSLLLTLDKYEPRDWEAEELDVVVETCRKVLQSVKLAGWQLGKTRVFLRAGQLAQLEGARGRKIARSAIVIQACWRAYLVRQWYNQQIALITKVQALWRGHQGRKITMQMKQERAATVIQKDWRMHKERSAFVAWRRNKAAVTIQAYMRMYLQREKFRRETIAGKRAAERAAVRAKQNNAATVIQSHWRGVLATRKVEAMRVEAAKWQTLTHERDYLENEASMWRDRALAAERRLAESDAGLARLQSELEASQMETQAKSVVAVEAANAVAKAALLSEMDLLRKQKDNSEAAMKLLQDQVREASLSMKARSSELEMLVETSKAKDEDNRKLLDQIKEATDRYEAEFAEKDREISELHEEVARSEELAVQDIAVLKAAMEAERLAYMEEKDMEVARLNRDLDDKSKALSSAQERNVHFSARLVALNARLAKLEKALQDSQLREASLLEDLEKSKKLGGARGLAVPTENGIEPEVATPTEGDAQGSGVLSPPPLILATAPHITTEAELADAEYDRMQISEYAGLDRDQERIIQQLLFGAVEKRLQIVNIQHGPKPIDAIGMPVAAWVIGECLLKWASRWRQTEMDIVSIRLKTSIMSNSTDLQLQAYWLSTSLALGAFLRVRTIGRRDIGNLFKFGDDMIHFTGLHRLLGESISEMIPLDINILLSTHSRKTRSMRGGAGKLSRDESRKRDHEGLMHSPWKGLLGGLSNVIENLRGEGTPASAVRAVVHATLCYINAALLNALLLRRDCCSISAVKALQSGLGDLKAWFNFMGSQWCGDAADVDRALEHVNQAVKYLLIGKDDCVRKASKGFDVMTDIKRMCPKLTVQQLYKLTEHHHDDWIAGFTGGSGTQTIVLLEVLKKHLDNDKAGEPGSPSSSTSGVSGGRSLATSGIGEDEDGLLLDPLTAFVLPRRLLTEAARQFVQAPRATGTCGPGVPLLDRIERSCKAVPLPRQLRNSEDFKFLA